jgi:hypothetical protein
MEKERSRLTNPWALPIAFWIGRTQAADVERDF